MAGVGRRIGGAIGAFARRLAMQALISSIVMTGIGYASRDDFAGPRAVLADLGFDGWNGSTAAAPTPAAPGSDKGTRLAYSPAVRGVVPAPAEATTFQAAAASPSFASPAVAPARLDPAPERPVLLFTQCAPACESRDPLILAAALPMAPPPPSTSLDRPPPELSPAPATSGDELPPPAALTARAAGEGSLMETTVALPGRALGAAAQLVGWGG